MSASQQQRVTFGKRGRPSRHGSPFDVELDERQLRAFAYMWNNDYGSWAIQERFGIGEYSMHLVARQLKLRPRNRPKNVEKDNARSY